MKHRDHSWSAIVLLAAVPLAALLGCGDNLTPAAPDAGQPDAGVSAGAIEPFPELYCPGSPTCANAGDSALRVGAARASITPDLAEYETEWTDENGDNHWESGEPFVDGNGNERFDAVWLAGFSNGRPATGVHDDIWVRAMVFDHGNTRVGLAVVDAIGWFANEMDATRELLDPALDIDHVIIASTHVHETPDTVGLWGAQALATGLDPDYQALVRQRTAEAITAAVAALEPVTMSVAQTLTVDETGSAEPYVSDSRDPIIIDPSMTIVHFGSVAEPGRTVATLVHWSAHPEYFWSRNNLITADYIFWIRDIVENGAAENPVRGLPALDGLGGEVVFLNGPIGGLIYPGRARPIDANGDPVVDNGLAKAEAAGTNLGRLALETITSAEMVTDVPEPALRFRTGRMYVTVENIIYHLGAMLGIFDRPFLGHDPARPIEPGNYPFMESRVSYLEIGNVAITTAPGELFPELAIGGYDGSRSYGFEFIDPQNPNPPMVDSAPQGPYLKDLMLMNPDVDIAIVAGMAEDFTGYIPPSYDYELHSSSPYLDQPDGDHYEETNSLGPGVEQEIVGTMRELITWTPPAP